MVVPAVRVVIKNHNCGIGTLWPVLEKIDRVHDERLLVQRIGISRVSVLEASSFQETDCGKITGGYCVKEIVDVVLILGNGVEWLSNCRYRGGTCMRRVRGRCIVLERLMVRNVINLFTPVTVEVVLRLHPVLPFEFVIVRSNPPSKKPHVTPAVLSRSPTLGPPIWT